jgi:hypothetical protein
MKNRFRIQKQRPMTRMSSARRVGRWVAGGVAVAVLGYASAVALAWLRFGRAAAASGPAVDPLLDRFVPQYDVVERHHIRVAASAGVTLAAAAQASLKSSALSRAIFRARELVLGARPDLSSETRGLLAEMKSIGWGVLAEEPGREIVMGAVTQPWLADVTFRALPPDQFARFDQPGYVKIAWTLRADPLSPSESTFRTETRAVATDAAARRKFRWYWARFSPGIALIRRALLPAVRADAERAQWGRLEAE